MVLSINPNFSIADFKEKMTCDVYYLFQGSESFQYKNIRMVKNNVPEFSYWGVTHEFLKYPDNSKIETIDPKNIFIKDIGDGGAKTDKFERDVALLLNGLKQSPNNERYTFYLANSYKDSNQYDKAIEYYKKRVQLGGWKEEVWHSYYSMGKCYKEKGDNANAVFNWLEAFNILNERVENIYEIIKHYRMAGKNNLAYGFYSMARNAVEGKTNYDHLFCQKDVYDYKLDYEFSILGHYCNSNKYDIIQSCMKVLACNSVDDRTLKNTLSNYKYYVPSLLDILGPTTSESTSNITEFSKIGLEQEIDRELFTSSTPSLCFAPKKYIISCLRHVNYKISNNGTYVNQSTIESKNVITIFDMSFSPYKKVKEFIMPHNKTYDSLYVGLEDVRLHYHDGKIYYNANRGISLGKIEIEHGIIDLNNPNKVDSTLCKMLNQNDVEKNWVLFNNNKNEMLMIYKWSPLTIGNLFYTGEDENRLCKFNTLAEIATPNFFQYVRGSSNGVQIEGDVWFLCHLVSYEKRRYYYHCFIVLDSTSYQVKKYSRIFSFENNPVEYSLGFVHLEDSDEFIIGYSIMDRETKYITLNKSKIDAWMIVAADR
jgi:tetratricopeptide (TPR) repeat protein